VKVLLLVVLFATRVSLTPVASHQDDPDDLYLKLPTFISSHMIFQKAPMKARVYGWATPNVTVTVVLDTYIVRTATANQDHSWHVELPPFVSSKSHILNISTSFTTIILDDIAFGDVYICAGQSNMVFSLIGAINGTDHIQDSIHLPHVRMATVANTMSDTPQVDVGSKLHNISWSRSLPIAFDTKDVMSYTSAVAYFFARELFILSDYKDPIGIIIVAWGGQPIELFSSPQALKDETCGGTVVPAAADLHTAPTSFLRQSESPSPKKNSDIQGGGNNSSIWNGMVHPLLPMRFKGVIWYQGEANRQNPSEYACRFPAMITDWRKQFELPELYFYYVQLAPIVPSNGGSPDWPYIRAAQDAALQLPQVGVAIASDLGDPKSPYGDIHPRYKQEVGQRLALLVRAYEHQEDGVVYQGPVFDGSIEMVDGGSAVILGFRPETEHGLHFNGTTNCEQCCGDGPSTVFHALNSDGDWVPVEGIMMGGNRILLELLDRTDAAQPDARKSSSRSQILGVRLNWESFPQCALYNRAGREKWLPAAPFEWCLYPSGEKPWTNRSCSTTPPPLLSIIS
jgi:sialate O-acetylesterase